MHNHIMWASTPCHAHDLSESCKISDRQEQSVKVNAFYYVVALTEWLSCPEQEERFVRTLRVGCKDTKSFEIDKEKCRKICMLRKKCLSLHPTESTTASLPFGECSVPGWNFFYKCYEVQQATTRHTSLADYA